VAVILGVAVVVGRVDGQRALAAVEVAAPSSLNGTGTFLFAGQPAFPIALSNPPPLESRSPDGADGLDEVVAAGVTVFRVGPMPLWPSSAISSIQAWDAAALERGVHTWVSLGDLSTAQPGSIADKQLQKVVTSVTTDPSGAGLGFWKGADEPALGGLTPTQLRFAYCRVTSRGNPRWCQGEMPLDPAHLWLTIEAPQGTPHSLSTYSRVTDTHGVDVYPIALGTSQPDLHEVGVWTHTLASVTPDHSVWTTLQICSSGSYSSSAYVLPTRTQERYMIYDAIINGARGLSFFGGDNPGCSNARDRALGWNWTFWNTVLSGLVGEIAAKSALAPALDNPGSTTALVTTDPATEAISRLAVSRTGKKELWVLVARAGPGTTNVTIKGLPRSLRFASVYTEHRLVTLANGTLTDRFSQWQVHVYRVPLDAQPHHP
jgi:hypothetical protein